MSRANEKRRDGELLSAWSMDGTVFVKTSSDGRPVKVIELEDLENLQHAKKYFGRGDGLSLSGSVNYLFILPAKRFSCSILCCCMYLFVCVVWIVYILVSLILFSLFYRVICIRVICPNLTS